VKLRGRRASFVENLVFFENKFGRREGRLYVEELYGGRPNPLSRSSVRPIAKPPGRPPSDTDMDDSQL